MPSKLSRKFGKKDETSARDCRGCEVRDKPSRRLHESSCEQGWKQRSKEVEIGPLLVSAQELLGEAEGGLGLSELHEVYKKTWMARGYLLKVQEILEKKRKKSEKSSSTT